MLMTGFLPSLADDGYYGVALLSHEGKQKAYFAENVQAAVDDALEGDTIFFSRGHFKDIVLNKKVYLQSVESDWALKVYLQLPDNTTLESSLFIGNRYDVWVRCNLKSIYLRGFSGYLYTGGSYKTGTVTFDRCNTSFDFNHFNVDYLYANNCVIDGIYEGNSTKTVSKFKNCNFFVWDLKLANATFENCIFNNNNEENITIDNCSLTRCLYDPNRFLFGKNAKLSDNYEMSQSEWNDDYEAMGFLGTDYTIVGAYGGSTPFEGLVPKDMPYIFMSDDYVKVQGKTIIGSWNMNPTR